MAGFTYRLYLLENGEDIGSFAIAVSNGLAVTSSTAATTRPLPHPEHRPGV